VSAMADLILAGFVAGGLFLYLLWALLRPEDL
jgi:K+-transporting ATPase KdpF subunit